MKKKLLAIIMLASLLLCALASCGKKGEDFIFTDKTYIYEKEGLGGAFTISINSDGTFTYKEGPDSNYYAHGVWTYVGGTLSLIDDLHGSDRSICNNFFIVDGSLWYISENSTGFAEVVVEEGDLFRFAYENTSESVEGEE